MKFASSLRPVVRLQPLLLGIGFALLIVIGGATVHLVNRSSSDARQLTDSLLIRDKFSDLLLRLRHAESSQRGYLFTGNDSYLDDFRQSGPEARRLIGELRAYAKDNPHSLAVVGRIAELVDAKFREMDDIIKLDQDGRSEDARAKMNGDAERKLMSSLGGMIEAAIHDEARLAASRAARSQQTNNLLLIATLIGTALIVLIGATSVVLVQRNARQREAARNELAGVNANLETIVAYRTADLTEANEEIQRFAYIVSHDLRSPLVNIMGFTSELEALRTDIFGQIEKLKAELAALNPETAETEGATVEQLGEDFDEAIRFIKSSIDKMDRLINAVLKLSREGRRQFQPELIDVNAMMDSILQTVAHRASEQGATMSASDLPGVESDRLALEQIFSNLVDNALKYSRPDEPLKIEIDGRTDASRVIYDFRDNGRGIDPRDHQRVFELFRRSGPQDRSGEGIGLAHVRALVRRLGGTMGLTSELGRGSTFTVALPRRWAVEKRSAA